jgi:hypothetical protein
MKSPISRLLETLWTPACVLPRSIAAYSPSATSQQIASDHRSCEKKWAPRSCWVKPISTPRPIATASPSQRKRGRVARKKKYRASQQ